MVRKTHWVQDVVRENIKKLRYVLDSFREKGVKEVDVEKLKAIMLVNYGIGEKALSKYLKALEVYGEIELRENKVIILETEETEQ